MAKGTKYGFVYLLSTLLVLISVSAFGQKLEVIAQIDVQLEEMGLDFYMPVENKLKFSKLKSSEFFEYDTKLAARSRELEILIALHPDGEGPLTSDMPHLEFNRLLANLTPNDDEQEVLIVGWNEDRLAKRNADWGAEAYFTPREEITKFPYVKLIAFFKEGHGMVVMLYCFDKPDALPLVLAFKKSEID